MKNTALAGSALLSAFVLASCTTTEEETPTDPQARFAKADRNGDGVLSRDEISDWMVTQVFNSRDADGDGVMTATEWWAGDDPEQEAAFRKRDLNGDGVVTLEEALAYGRTDDYWDSLVKEADLDGDGKISWEEVETYYSARGAG